MKMYIINRRKYESMHKADENEINRIIDKFIIDIEVIILWKDERSKIF